MIIHILKIAFKIKTWKTHSTILDHLDKLVMIGIAWTEVHVLLIEEKPDAYALKCLEGIFANTNQGRGNIKDRTVSLYWFFYRQYEWEKLKMKPNNIWTMFLSLQGSMIFHRHRWCRQQRLHLRTASEISRPIPFTSPHFLQLLTQSNRIPTQLKVNMP